MSRSGYHSDGDPWQHICYRGQVHSAIRGKRGQRMFCELLTALEAMESKRLIDGDLIRDGDACALGVLGKARGIEMGDLDADNPEEIGASFDIAHQLAAEVVYMNDDGGPYFSRELPEARWIRMHAWVSRQIRSEE